MWSRPRVRFAPIFALLVAASCGSGGGPTDAGEPDSGMTGQDLAQYNTLQMQLDQGRTQFLPSGASNLDAEQNTLYWIDFPTAAPALHRLDDTTGARLDYGFSIGDADHWNDRARGAYIVTASSDGSTVTYSAYDATQANHLVATTQLPAPTDGTQWYAYAVASDGNVYIVTTGAMTTVLRWVPGSTPTMVTTLESAGVMVGEFTDFDVDGHTMVFIESGRLWQLDLTTNTATWLHNMTQVGSNVEFESDGVLFTTTTTLLYFRYSDDMLLDLGAALESNTYQLNATFSSAHYFDASAGGFTRWGSWVIYTANAGMYAYNLTSSVVQPVLLAPNSSMLRIDYRYPAALADGKLFVVGLTSTDGSVGADGPVYEVDLTMRLQ